MGNQNICCCDSLTNIRYLNTNEFKITNELILFLQKINKKEHLQISKQDIQKINIGIQTNNYPEKINNYKIIINIKNKCCLSLTLLKLDSNQGYILYKKKYYKGIIINNQPQGKGQQFIYTGQQSNLSTQNNLLRIQGIWKNGQLYNGILYNNQNQKQFQIDFIDTNRIKIKYDNEKIQSITFIRQQFNKLINLKDIKIDQAQIKYKDQSSYKGPLKDGLMDTSLSSKKGEYKTKNQLFKYVGDYRNGLRHGEGLIQIKEDFKLLRFQIKYQNGIFIEQSIQKVENDPRKTLFKLEQLNEQYQI